MRLSKHFLLSAKTLVEAEIKRLADMVEPIKSKLSQTFPDAFLAVVHSTNIMDKVSIQFAKEPKENWPNNIYQNASYITLMINEKNGGQREGDSGVYVVKALAGYKTPKFIAKSGSAEQIVKYILNWFDKNKRELLHSDIELTNKYG